MTRAIKTSPAQSAAADPTAPDLRRRILSIARSLVMHRTPSPSLVHYLQATSDFGLTNLCAHVQHELEAAGFRADGETIRQLLIQEGTN